MNAPSTQVKNLELAANEAARALALVLAMSKAKMLTGLDPAATNQICTAIEGLAAITRGTATSVAEAEVAKARADAPQDRVDFIAAENRKEQIQEIRFPGSLDDIERLVTAVDEALSLRHRIDAQGWRESDGLVPSYREDGYLSMDRDKYTNLVIRVTVEKA